jgi:hypothetical protein
LRRLPQASPPSQGSGRDVLTGPAGPDRPSWGFSPLQRHESERSASRGSASPATVRPRSFSLPRRVAPSPASRTREVRCRSWGFGSESSFEREGRDAFPRPLRPLDSGASRSHALASTRSSASDSRERLSPHALVPWPWSQNS